MVAFQQVPESRLFESQANDASAGWWGILLPSTVTPPLAPVTLEDALNDPALNATFVYAASTPTLSGSGLAKFTDAVQSLLNKIIETRALIFLSDPADVSTAIVAGLRQQDTQVLVNTGVNVILTGVVGIPQLQAEVAGGSSIAISSDGNALVLTGSGGPAVTIGGLGSSDTFQPQNTATLSFSGPNQGTFTFGIFIQRQALRSKLDWGFQVIIPNDNQGAEAAKELSALLPLGDGTLPNATDMIGFTCQVNLVNPNNELAASPTVFFFTGQNSGSGPQNATVIVSYFRTNAGTTITLIPVTDTAPGQYPAGLTINPGFGTTPLQNGFRFAPCGDFVLSVPSPVPNRPEYLLCGLSGTETIAFLPVIDGVSAGSRIRFTMNQPADAPRYPVPPSSPTGPPIDPASLLLDSTYQTAWGNIVSAPSASGAPMYAAAPEGADLFGADKVVSPQTGMLGPVTPGVALPAALTYPLFPMAGFLSGTGEQDMTTEQLAGVERQILGPTRRSRITNAGASHAASPHLSLGLAAVAEDACPFNCTTPTGFITHVRCDGSWDQLLLAQMMQNGTVTNQVGFTLLQSELQAAFQTSNLFLVVANAKYLGKPSSGTFMPPGGSNITDQNLFFNTFGLAGWTFNAAVGAENAYGDYRNVMIVKGVKGKLTDLVLSPETWTMKDKFGAPSIKLAGGGVSDPDMSQLIPLSNWLSDYFGDALKRALDPFFAAFNTIIQDPDWTGVLLLRADIAKVPSDLAGIASGVDDASSFNAHHMGFAISQINGGKIQQQDSTSAFGLIYYVDPGYDDRQAPHPIAPREQAPYTFTLLTLKALFQNSALTKFDSLAQLTLNQLFGAPVTGMAAGNIYNAVLLTGAFQMNGSAPVYSLSSATANTWLLANNVLTQVEIDTAVMSTRDDGGVSGTVVSWIALSGYMNFALITVPGQTLPDVDFFSFGDAASPPGPRTGLNFSSLALEIRAAAGGSPQINLVEREISFNTGASTARENSLFLNLQLELLGMVSGTNENAPQSLGYLTVGTEYGLQGVSNRPWHALRFKANLGTPGALASKVNLNSTLLCAWSDDSQGQTGYRAMIGILLPGAGSGGNLFSLQTVLKLSVGAIQLYYNKDQKSYLLLLNEIALKFLGLLKIPPNGSTAFFLFGGPGVTSPTGLGWYAVYNQDQPKPSRVSGIGA